MAKLRLTKKAITFIVIGVVLLGGGLGYGLWYLNNEASQVATEDSEAAPPQTEDACDRAGCADNTHRWEWNSREDACKKVLDNTCKTEGEGDDSGGDGSCSAPTGWLKSSKTVCDTVFCDLASGYTSEYQADADCGSGQGYCKCTFQGSNGGGGGVVTDSCIIVTCKYGDTNGDDECKAYGPDADTGAKASGQVDCDTAQMPECGQIDYVDENGVYSGYKENNMYLASCDESNFNPPDEPEDNPSCGDGTLDSGETCELGDPSGAACGWTDTCNQSTCNCTPVVSQNPDWSLNKFSGGSCGTDGTSATIDYIITVTNIGAVDGQIATVEDTLDAKVIESEIDLASISPSATVFGNVITWNLTGDAATFAPGESKTYQYSITVPQDEFGTYNNTVVVTPVTGDPFEATNQRAVDCDSLTPADPEVPETALFDSTVSRVVAAGMLIAAGFAYMYSDSVWGTTMNIASYFGYDQRLDRARKKFEKRLED